MMGVTRDLDKVESGFGRGDGVKVDGDAGTGVISRNVVGVDSINVAGRDNKEPVGEDVSENEPMGRGMPWTKKFPPKTSTIIRKAGIAKAIFQNAFLLARRDFTYLKSRGRAVFASCWKTGQASYSPVRQLFFW
jgi:hypothetical protein